MYEETKSDLSGFSGRMYVLYFRRRFAFSGRSAVEITADGSDLAAEVPEFSGDSYVVVNDNQPDLRKKISQKNLMSITANWMNWDGVRRPRPISAKT